MVGTVKWRIQDDSGKVHNIILPHTYYSPSVETRLLSPQHWAQVRGRKRDTYCITYYDAIIMRWNRVSAVFIPCTLFLVFVEVTSPKTSSE
jgi:hypothetical protein